MRTDNDLKDPLISIIVITYNSSEYVLETLESAKAQTYQNIELIISDDSSSDNTIKICTDWLKKNKERFVNTNIITVEKNTGVSANCNRGLKAAKGLWIKPIAGDDALMIDCLKNNIEFVKANVGVNFCFSEMDYYQNTFEDIHKLVKDNSQDKIFKNFSKLNNEYQLKVLIRAQTINSPTVFYNRSALLSKIGGYDESYTFLEDWTTYYKWLKTGEKIYYLPEKTVKYRLNSESITNKKNANGSTFKPFTLKVDKVVQDLFYNQYTLKEKLNYKYRYFYYRFVTKYNNSNLLFRIIRRALYYLVELSLLNKQNIINNIYDDFKKLETN